MRRLTVLVVALAATSCAPEDVASPEPSCGEGLANVAEGEASASSSLQGFGPDLAFDGDDRTAWSAEFDQSEPWIEIDLGETRKVVCVRLLSGGDEGDAATHRVNGGAHTNPGRELGTIVSPDRATGWFELEGEWEFRFLRVTTLSSTEPPSWYEIEVR